MRLHVTIVGAIALAGCITRDVSTLSAYVRDIKSTPESLVVISCEIEHETTTNYFWWLLNRNASQDHELRQGKCWQQPIPKVGMQ